MYTFFDILSDGGAVFEGGSGYDVFEVCVVFVVEFVKLVVQASLAENGGLAGVVVDRCENGVREKRFELV